MRAIVSTPDVLGGRWRLDGHRIDVKCIRGWLKLGGLDLFNSEFPHVNLTQEEADACMAWEFPAILERPELNDEIRVRCVCGEYIDEWLEDGETDLACDYCGRKYRMTIEEAN